MALDWEKIIETNQKVMEEYIKIETKRKTLRKVLSLLNEIKFVENEKETKPAFPAIIEDGKVTDPGSPAEHETEYLLPKDRSIPGQTIKVERQQAIYDDCIAQLKKIGINL